MKVKKQTLAAFFVSGAFLIGNSASADKLDSSFNVKLAISSLCSIKTVDDVDFGLVDSTFVTQTKNTQLMITCNDQKPYTVALKPSNMDEEGRGEMTSTATGQAIAYNLYQDAATTIPWGANTNAVSNTGDGTAQALPVYVKVDGKEFNKAAGSYNDVVSVAVSY